MQKYNLRNGDVVSGAFLAALGLYIVAQAYSWNYYNPDGPGPGFFPTWYGLLMIGLALALIIGTARKPKPQSHAKNWDGSKRALITWLAFAACIATMGVLGFRLSFTLFTFFLVAFVFQRTLVAAALTSCWSDGRLLYCLSGPARRPTSHRLVRVLNMDIADGLLHGFSRRAAADKPAVVFRRLLARHRRRHPAGPRAGGDDRDAAAADLQHGSSRRRHHAGRHLLRRQIRRLHHLDPAQHAGRIVLGRHLPRRLSDGAQGPRRRGARHRRDRLLRRRHCRHRLADVGRAAGRRLRAVASLRRNISR